MSFSSLESLRTLAPRLLILISVLALASCGGGGSNGNTGAPTVSTDATLSALSISSGTLLPSFTSGNISYSDSVGSTISSVTVNATTTDSNGTIKVNGAAVVSGANSGPISLTVGTNNISVAVTAQDGTTTRIYSTTVTRAAGNDATLSALSISSGTLSPGFSSTVISYSDSVNNSVTSVTVNASTTDSDAILSVNSGSTATGTNSAVVSLGVGSTSIPVVVTSQDGSTTNTYTITVKRLPALSALSLTNASYTPVFQSTQLSYDSTVNFLVNAIGVTAATNDIGDSLTIDSNSATSGTLLSPVYLATGSNTVATKVTSSDGNASQTYNIAVTRSSSLNQQEYNAPDAVSNDDFGVSIAISGNTMVIGADQKSTSSTLINNGAAYVFVRTSSTGSWTQQAVLTADNAASSDDFGKSVAIDGNTIVVGAPYQNGTSGFNEGAAYVFTRSGTSWSQTGYLKASDAANLDYFGNAVAISGNTIVVGAYNKSNVLSGAGAAYVFAYDSGTSLWNQQQEITASDASSSDQFGNSVAIEKDTLVVGAPQHDSSSTVSNDGAAYVFTRSSSTWSEQTILQANNAAAGDNFGKTVSINGSSIAIGATGQSSNAGAAYVFTGSGSSWTQQAYLTASNAGANDYFGHSIAISGERLVVGADQEDGDINSDGTPTGSNDNASNSGAVYVFMRSGSSWTQTNYLKAYNLAASDYFGSSVGIDNDTLVTGARGATATQTTTATNAGGVYAFQ